MKEVGVKKRPALPTDDEPILSSERPRLPVTATARFSHFPFDLVARYVNHRVEFTVERLWTGTGKELETPWVVRKLT